MYYFYVKDCTFKKPTPFAPCVKLHLKCVSVKERTASSTYGCSFINYFQKGSDLKDSAPFSSSNY